MSFSNYHTHTTYCDGKNTPEELILQALRLGCPALGFSGHSYTWFDESYCMTLAGTAAYRQEITRLKEKYSGKIKIYLGIEQDYYASQPTEAYDYVIGAVHYVCKNGTFLPVDESKEMQKQAVAEHYNGDFYAFIEDYYQVVESLYEKTHCDIIAHFDLITKFNEQGDLFDPLHPRYRAAAAAAFEKLCQTPAVFEINTGAMARGIRTAPYPAEEWIEQLRQKGKRFVFSADCHRAEQLLFGFDVLAKKYGAE